MESIINTKKQGFKKTDIGLIPDYWKFDTIGNCMSIENNKRTPISEEERSKIKGVFPYYGPTKIQDYINVYQYEGDYVLIAEDGDHFLKYKEVAMTQYVSGKFNVNNHAHVLKGTDKCLTEWFFWFYNHRNVFNYITRQGAGRYKLNKASLESMPIVYPTLPEQQKIAQILYTWDKAIEQTQKLIEKLELRKKGLMQQLLTGKTRLESYSDKWVTKSFNEIFKPKKVKVGEAKLTVFSVTKGGIIPQSEYFKKEVASEDTSSYLVIEKGDIVMSGLNFWMGSIDILLHYEKGIVSPAYKIFKVKNPSIDMTFIRFFIRSEIFLKALISSSVQGASIVRRNLDYETLEYWPFAIPAHEEQKAIGRILLAADNEIKAQNKILEQLQSQKKGLMQQLLTGQKRVQV